MSVMGDMLKVLSMPCRKHADIISRSFDDELSKGTRWGLWVHERYCTGCRGYHQQFQDIRDGAAKLFGVEQAQAAHATPARSAGASAGRPAAVQAHVASRCPPEVRERLVAAVARRSASPGS